MLPYTDKRGARHASMLAGANLIVLGLSAGVSLARADNDWQCDFRQDDHYGMHDRDHTRLEHDSLAITASTYDNTQGAVTMLKIGSTLPNTDTATGTAVANNDYVNVWNNDNADGSFGISSEITILDVNPVDGKICHAREVPPDQVVTSFSSKSELSLHGFSDERGPHVTFVGYAGAGVGAIDVSASDAVPGQDPTNPVTFAFGTNYAFHRTIVSMDQWGHFLYTPTIDYGGDNGRGAILGTNGLYYAVGNSNNGNATTFSPPSNGTNPDVTETTGLEVVNPILAENVNVTIPANNSAEVDPLMDFTFPGKKPDKAGKDDNFRGVVEFGGAIYVVKGSGSNGIDSIYTVDTLPTVANAASQVFTIPTGFPTDSAKATGGNFTPFGIFFANATTVYVADEGSGDTADATTHAGLEKWSLVDGSWQLDYVLTKGLINNTYNVTGFDGPYPTVTVTGLRNLTGSVDQHGHTVTLWATTSTSSASGDNGADPNQVVRITDDLDATTMDSLVSQKAFTAIAGPTYGTVYRGVAYVP
jgi:hypothetical protein